MKKNNYYSLWTILFFVSLCIPLYSQNAKTKLGGTVSVSSGYVSENPIEAFSNSADVKLSLNASSLDALKINLEGIYSFYSFSKTEVSPAVSSFSSELTKAYAKLRLPVSDSSDIRINIGKQPFSMGFGLIFNAGDLISPSDLLDNTKGISSSGLEDLRGFTDWIAHVQFNTADIFTADVFYIFPFEMEQNSEYGRAGLKTLFRLNNPILESVESAFLIQGDAKKIQSSLSLDGTLWADYNLCTSIGVDESADSQLQFNKRLWNMSLGLNKVFTIQTDTANHSLSSRVESLYYPIEKTLSVVGLLSYQLLSGLTLDTYYMFTSSDLTSSNTFTHILGAGLSWEPIQNTSFSLSAVCGPKNPKDLFLINAGVKCSF